MKPQLSIIVPVYNEGEHVTPYLDRLLTTVETPCEVLIVHDMPDDSTVPVANRYAAADPRVRPTLNTYGRGPANAIRFGLEHAAAPVAVVTMADGSDDPTQIDRLAELIGNGTVIACASRYMKGGSQPGGPRLKKLLSRGAGVTLHLLGRVGTHDATNSFKAYSTDFVRKVGIESDGGFEVGIELVAKAKRWGYRVVEIPTTWNDRTEGDSQFRLMAWIPRYLRWYAYGLGLGKRSGRSS